MKLLSVVLTGLMMHYYFELKRQMNVEEKYYDRIVDFIKAHLDDSIQKLEMVNIDSKE